MIGEKNELKMRISQRMLCGKIANRQTHMMLNRNKILLMFTNFSFCCAINRQHDRNEFWTPSRLSSVSSFFPHPRENLVLRKKLDFFVVVE